jgi:hypothetical protein
MDAPDDNPPTETKKERAEFAKYKQNRKQKNFLNLENLAEPANEKIHPIIID